MKIGRKLIIVMATTALAGSLATAGSLAAEKPVAPEHNPPGDIPDTQVFVSLCLAARLHDQGAGGMVAEGDASVGQLLRQVQHHRGHAFGG